MKLTVVGCSGSFPGPDSPASCYLLEHEHEGRTWRVLLDLGSGALGALQRYADPLAIDAVLLSHLHPDHCLDLCGYYVLRKYHPDGRPNPLPVYGPSDTAERMTRAYGLPDGAGMSEEFDFRTWTPRKPVTIGPFGVEVVRVEHPVEAYGLRIRAGDRLLAYTGDSGICKQLVKLAAHADLLLAEASFRDGEANPPGIHLTGADCGRLVKSSGAKWLVLTHVPPWYDGHDMLEAAHAQWTGPIDLATPGAIYEV